MQCVCVWICLVLGEGGLVPESSALNKNEPKHFVFKLSSNRTKRKLSYTAKHNGSQVLTSEMVSARGSSLPSSRASVSPRRLQLGPVGWWWWWRRPRVSFLKRCVGSDTERVRVLKKQENGDPPKHLGSRACGHPQAMSPFSKSVHLGT